MRNRPKHASPLPLGAASPQQQSPASSSSSPWARVGGGGLLPVSGGGGVDSPTATTRSNNTLLPNDYNSGNRSHNLFCELILPMAHDDVYYTLPAKTTFVFTEEVSFPCTFASNTHTHTRANTDTHTKHRTFSLPCCRAFTKSAQSFTGTAPSSCVQWRPSYIPPRRRVLLVEEEGKVVILRDGPCCDVDIHDGIVHDGIVHDGTSHWQGRCLRAHVSSGCLRWWWWCFSRTIQKQSWPLVAQHSSRGHVS